MLPEIPRELAIHPGQPPRRELARWATLPHLLPLLAQAPKYVPHVVVRLSRTTATITGFDRTGRKVRNGTDEGQNHPAHKASAGGMAHYSIQHRTEEVWARNSAPLLRTSTGWSPRCTPIWWC